MLRLLRHRMNSVLGDQPAHEHAEERGATLHDAAATPPDPGQDAIPEAPERHAIEGPNPPQE